MNKSAAIILLGLLWGGCSSESADPNRLSVKDLKFPALYTIEEQTSLPNTDGSPIVMQKVDMTMAFLQVGNLSEYPQSFRDEYKEACKYTRQNATGIHKPDESFTLWFWKRRGGVEGYHYNAEGKLIAQNRTCFMCGTHRYTYDSLGFCVSNAPGGCTMNQYFKKYRFDPDKRILYYCDTGINFSSDDRVKRLYFDTVGHLCSLEFKDIESGRITTSRYIYDAQGRIRTILKQDSLMPGGESIKAPAPHTIGSRATYYYSGSIPDSIVADFYVLHGKGVHHTQKMYFDSTGLPTSSVYINFPEYYRTTEVKKFVHHRYQLP